MKELTLLAAIDNLPTVLSFLEEQLEEADCPLKTQMRLAVAAECAWSAGRIRRRSM